MATRDDKPVTLREFAAHRGCNVSSVTKAIQRGRLVKSVVRVKGQPKLRSFAEANAEWEANERPRWPARCATKATQATTPWSPALPESHGDNWRQFGAVSVTFDPADGVELNLEVPLDELESAMARHANDGYVRGGTLSQQDARRLGEFLLMLSQRPIEEAS